MKMKFKDFLLLFLTSAVTGEFSFGNSKLIEEFARSHAVHMQPFPLFGNPNPSPQMSHTVQMNMNYSSEPQKKEQKIEEKTEEKKWNLDAQKVKFIIKSETFVSDVLSKNKEFNNKIAKTEATGAPEVIFNRGLKSWFNNKTENWENQTEVKDAFLNISKEIESVYSTSEWLNIKNKKGQILQKCFWHKAMFLLHALFKLFDKIFDKLINDVETKSISDTTCSEIFEIKNQEESLKLLKNHKEMLDKNLKKINEYFISIEDNYAEHFKKWNDFKEKNLFDVEIVLPQEEIKKIKFFILKNDFIFNIVKKIVFFNEKKKRAYKITNAVDILIQFNVESLKQPNNKEKFVDWLKEIINDWKDQPESSNIFKEIKQIISKDYGIKENSNNFLRKSNWPYLMFMLHTIFYHFEKVLQKIDEKPEIKKNIICSDEFYQIFEKKDCDETFKKLNEMLVEDDVYINKFFELESAKFNDKEILSKWKRFKEKNLFEVEIDVPGAIEAKEEAKPEEKKDEEAKELKIRSSATGIFPQNFDQNSHPYPFHPGYGFHHIPMVMNTHDAGYNKAKGTFDATFHKNGYNLNNEVHYFNEP